MKRAYFLAANESSETPSSLLFVDTEAWSDNPFEPTGPARLTFRLGVACHVRLEAGEVRSEEWLDFDSPLEFWQFHERCQQYRKPLWTFAHNLPFDLTLLHFWERLEAQAFKVFDPAPEGAPESGKKRKSYKGMLCLEDRPCFARVKGVRGTCWFADSMNYFPCSLEALGKSLGFKKGKWPGFDAETAALRSYCRQDVAVLKRAILGLMKEWKQEDCGNWKPTAAGLALANYRHWHCDKRSSPNVAQARFNIVIEPEHEAIPLERESYLGGRIEAFYFGRRPELVPAGRQSALDESPVNDGPYYLLDVRSLYPFVMATGDFPRERIGYVQTMDIADLHHWAHKAGATARVLISSPHDTYPVRLDGQQLHASGRFVTVLCGAELRRALEAGHVAAVYETCLYKLAPLFHDWVWHWWQKRLAAETAGDLPKASLAKLILNALSAKWAQRPERWEDKPGEWCSYRWGEWSVVDAETGLSVRRRGIGGNVQERVTGDEPPHSFPAISAFITSAAREYMRQIINHCPAESVYYLATDGLICNRFALDALKRHRLIEASTLGKLAVKGEYGEIEIQGQNAYRLDGQFVASGLWGRAEPVAGNRYRAQIWQRLKSIISERPDGSITITTCDLEALVGRPKGELLASGWTKPRHFDEPPVHYQTPVPKRAKHRKDTDLDDAE